LKNILGILNGYLQNRSHLFKNPFGLDTKAEDLESKQMRVKNRDEMDMLPGLAH
jgi:hypothetical protein